MIQSLLIRMTDAFDGGWATHSIDATVRTLIYYGIVKIVYLLMQRHILKIDATVSQAMFMFILPSPFSTMYHGNGLLCGATYFKTHLS